MAVGVGNDDVACPELREQLLDKLEGRVVLDRQWRLWSNFSNSSTNCISGSREVPGPCSS